VPDNVPQDRALGCGIKTRDVDYILPQKISELDPHAVTMRKRSRMCISTRDGRQMPWLPILHSRGEMIACFAGHVLLHEEVLVAEMNELVMGFMAMEGDHVDHLYIAPAYQGRGIGDTLLAMAKELRPSGLTLWTFQRNAQARRFYEARGFVASEFTDGSRNEEREPDVLYAWLPNASSASA
jgi:GNAT superfamily N-acetyltransferase